MKHQAYPLSEAAGRGSQGSEAQEQLRWVLDEIAELGDRDRQLCQLCLIEGVSYRDAAAVLGTSPAAARKRIERLRIRLRNAVSDND